jgi:hypothetical protein
MKSDSEPKMAQFLGRLTHWEQQIICHQVRTHSGEQRYAHLHPSLLPFVPLSVARKAINNAKHTRAVAAISAKLPGYIGAFSTMAIVTDKKVLRMFGPNPEKGRNLKWLPQLSVRGAPVSTTVALVRKHNGTGFGVWEINVAREHRDVVMNWLCDTCG